MLGAAHLELKSGKLVWVNSAFASIVGYTASEVLGMSLVGLLHADERPAMEAGLARVRAGELSTLSVDRRYRHKDGHFVWVNVTATVMCDVGGKPTHMIGILQDISERKHQELELRKSEARLRLVMEQGKIGMWEMDPITNEVVWSKVFKELCGVPEDFLPSQDSFQNLVHPDDREQVARGAEELKTGRSDFPSFRIVRPDGGVRWLQNVGKVIRVEDERGPKLAGSIVDVTEVMEAQKIIEAQKAKMLSASKMSALGEMAAGLAHEINNPVAIIHGNAILLNQLSARGAVASAEIKKTSKIIASTAERISKITRALRAFARDAEQDPFEVVSLKHMLDETAEFCRQRFLSHGIEFITDGVCADLKIQCQPVQISQVLLNLLNNAHDAVENASERWIRISTLDCGERVEIHVEDSGTGISPEMRDRIFQPFFTTKDVGKGTGLGLSVAKGIVESHSGWLGVLPTNKNTCFVVQLPKRQSEASLKA